MSYRLGAFGFLASQELLATGVKTNNGIRDQRAALTWIRRYADGFGGDPNSITVVGVSTGASKTWQKSVEVTASNAGPSSFLPPSSRVFAASFQENLCHGRNTIATKATSL